MSTPPLLTCPCCSSRAKTQEIWAGNGMPHPTARVVCSKCGCMVQAETDWVARDMVGALARAIDQWNTRPEEALARELAEAETLIDLIHEECLKSNAPLGRSDSAALDRIRTALTERKKVAK